MKVSEQTRLCDSIEIGCIQLRQKLSQEDIVRELMLGDPTDAKGEEILRDKIADAFLLAQKRSSLSSGYPFSVTDKTIELTIATDAEIVPYLFLLLGSSIKGSGVPEEKKITQNFQKYFEDLVCWSFAHDGYKSFLLSMPRVERGLPRALKPALKEIAKNSGEPAVLQEHRIASTDKDLGLDIIVTNLIADESRSGKPTFLIQCATGALKDLPAKLAEGGGIFPNIWQNGFYKSSSIQCVATPDDLLMLSEIDWDRLCANGWILDRMRLTRMFEKKTSPHSNATNLSNHWANLVKQVPRLNWRTSWNDN
jgi:hypothetical protein